MGARGVDRDDTEPADRSSRAPPRSARGTPARERDVQTSPVRGDAGGTPGRSRRFWRSEPHTNMPRVIFSVSTSPTQTVVFPDRGRNVSCGHGCFRRTGSGKIRTDELEDRSRLTPLCLRVNERKPDHRISAKRGVRGSNLHSERTGDTLGNSRLTRPDRGVAQSIRVCPDPTQTLLCSPVPVRDDEVPYRRQLSPDAGVVV